jgi:hypothetical protein
MLSIADSGTCDLQKDVAPIFFPIDRRIYFYNSEYHRQAEGGSMAHFSHFTASLCRKTPLILIFLFCFIMTSVSVAQGDVTLTVDFSAAQYPISPLIYGMNFADADLAAELQLPINRWGGNDRTRYNWQIDTSNQGSDYFFENIPRDNPNPGNLPDGSLADRFIEQNISTGTQTYLLIPMIGWTAKSRKEQPYDCGFSVAKYGAQQETDFWQPDCGNGMRPDGVTPVTGNDPADTSIPIDHTFVQAWMQHLISKYGNAANGGVRYYNLDNEPFLWNYTHRDIHPQPLGYDGLRDKTYQYAAAIKAVDPTAMVGGPGEFGWSGYFYSALDMAAGGDWWNTRPDRMAHGDIPFIEWYLQQMKVYEEQNGIRILDYVDQHYYPQGGTTLNNDVDPNTAALRLRSTRSLWDPTYIDESWIGDSGEPPIRMIPRMREWVADNYPGTKTAIGEYNFGGNATLNGAITQADVLGIFGRERLDLATMWWPPEVDEPVAYAFRMYLNYDGEQGKFGDRSVSATSTDQSQLAIYAAHRTSDNTLTVIVINKTNNNLTSPVQLHGFHSTGTAEVYRYSGANLNAIQQLADQAVTPTGFSTTFPPTSITLFVMERGVVDSELLVNNSFETAGSSDKSAANWSEDQMFKARRKCNQTGKPPIAHSGECAIQFKGVAGVKSTITQAADVSSIAAGDTLTLSAWVYAKKLSDGAAKLQGKVSYSDGTKLKLKPVIASGDYPYTLIMASQPVAGTPNSAKVKITLNQGSGKFFIDDVSLLRTPAGRSETPSLIPLP